MMRTYFLYCTFCTCFGAPGELFRFREYHMNVNCVIAKITIRINLYSPQSVLLIQRFRQHEHQDQRKALGEGSTHVGCLRRELIPPRHPKHAQNCHSKK